jgi:GNAT superfamily N-acetyltransferase
MLKDVAIEPFRGDWEGLQAMAHSSWRDEYGIESFPDFYRPDYLRFLFERLKNKDHLIAAYQGDELVSFMANIPQTFALRGQIYRSAYSCLLVTRKNLLRKGLGTAIVQEALKLNKEYRYDFALFTLETGHRSTLMINKLKEAGSPVEHVKKIYVIARILDLDQASYSGEISGQADRGSSSAEANA